MKRVLFCAGDVGGARAVLAVALAHANLGQPLVLLDHGPLAAEAPLDWPRISPECLSQVAPGDTADILSGLEIGAIAFGSSVADPLPLAFVRKAQIAGLPLLHVLDHWTAYRRRMETDGGPALAPERYAVMDELAAVGVMAAGIAPASVVLTGQPALADLGAEAAACDIQARMAFRSYLGVSGHRRLLVFVSEPVAADQGDSLSPIFRGYTEADVLELLCQILKPYVADLFLVILPHPREDPTAVAWRWEYCRGTLAGTVVQLPWGRQAVLVADAVAGMASILLYEAWCLGLPVFSLQPSLCDPNLRLFLDRPGVTLVEDATTAAAVIWSVVIAGSCSGPRPDLARHAAAPALLVEILAGLAYNTNMRTANGIGVG
ncbi:conserved hypothetical protein [Desulfovibrionales bacterium]